MVDEDALCFAHRAQGFGDRMQYHTALYHVLSWGKPTYRMGSRMLLFRRAILPKYRVTQKSVDNIK